MYNSHRRSVTLILLFAAVIVLACPLVGGVLSVLAEPPGRLRSTFGILLVLGFCVAIWATFFVEYQAGPNYRILGFPWPVVLLHLESGRWVDFVGGPGAVIDMVV